MMPVSVDEDVDEDAYLDDQHVRSAGDTHASVLPTFYASHTWWTS